MKRSLALLALLVLSLPLCGKPVSADVAATPQPFIWLAGSATSSTGTLGPFPCGNANTGTFTFTTGGGASFTVKTAADDPYSSAYATDTSFGSSGVIVAPGANSQSSGALGASAVLYVQATYTGNTGTIAGKFTCTASTTGGGGSGGSSAAPCPTNASQQCVVAIASPVDGNSNVKVVAENTISPIPAATPSAGAAPPASLIPVVAIDHCIHQNGLAAPALTAGNMAPILCDDLDRLMINTSDPGIVFVKSGAIASAVTTLLVAGVNNKRIYVYMSAWESTGTNATNTVNWEYGQGATCATNTTTLFPVAIAPGTAAGEWLAGWSGWSLGAITPGSMPAPAAFALPLPLNATGYGWCGITAGTTTAGTFVTAYSVHDY